MGLLKKLREAVVTAVGQATAPDETSSELVFQWRDWPDPQLPDKRVHECPLPHGAYFLVQEVSAPEPGGAGHWGWMLMNAECEPVEMRNGFHDDQKAKEHAEAHYRKEYAGTDS
jgi:hypothetical protein